MLKNVRILYAYELRDNYTGRVEIVAELAYKIRELEARIKEVPISTKN